MSKPMAFSICVALACIMSGCSSLDKGTTGTDKKPLWDPLSFTSDGKKEESEIEFGVPQRMALIWKDTVYTSDQAPPTRGFGGRIYFFDNKGKTIRVDGDLIVYGFDDSDNQSEKSHADIRFEFKHSDFQRHFSKSEIGDSYSIWLPWDRVGGERKTITLFAIFKTKQGQLVKGGQDIVVLPGRTKKPVANQKSDDGKIQNVGYLDHDKMKIDTTYLTTQVSHESDENGSRIRTTTIPLSRQLSKRLSQLPPNTAAAPADSQPAGTQNQVPSGVNPYHFQKLQEMNRQRGITNVKYGSRHNQQQNFAFQKPQTSDKDSQEKNGNPSIFDRQRKPQNPSAFGAPGSFR